jgi:predicted phosphodiesterase
VIDNELLQKQGESFLDYCDRLIFGKENGIYDIDKSEIWKLLFDEELSSDEARKRLYAIKKIIKKLKENYKNELPKTQLDEIREKVGELDILKQQVKNEKNELNKIKRDFVKSLSIAEELKEYLAEHCTIVIPEYCNEAINQNSEYEMILIISDWHIGYIIEDCKGNYYNWEIANQRIDKLINECYKYIEMYNIKKINVINLSDTIEHTYMRANQSQFTEFNQSEQINKAIELIYRLIVALCKYCFVEYDSIYGNHDRMSGDKNNNQDGDNAETIIREQLLMYVKLSNNQRAEVVDRKHTDKEIIKEINGVKCKFVHGDKSRYSDSKIAIKNEISTDNEFYDLLCHGHLHNHQVISENNGRYIISTGCLSGFNDYSLNFSCATVASQTVIILGEGKIELIKDIQLQ